MMHSYLLHNTLRSLVSKCCERYDFFQFEYFETILNNDATQSPDFSRGVKELLVLYTMTLYDTLHDDCKVQV